MNTIPQQATEAVAYKVASGVQVAGTGLAVGSGGVLVLGLTPTEWSVVGIIGGLVIAAAGVIVKSCMDWYFQAQHLKLAQARINAALPGGD